MITLHNIHIIKEGLKDVICNNGKITSISTADKENNSNGAHFYFDNALAFPGLINSHDHLDFDLFPMLGNRIYKNYLEWGDDIHRQNKKIIDEILSVPKELRIQWGIYKNLLNGITTVFNHGKKLKINDAIIDVFKDKNALHSVRLEKNWRLKLNNPFNNKEPYVIHVGEGTDDNSCKEIDELIKWNKLNKKLIGIHGVAMNVAQAHSFQALIWCPDSNFFLLDKTAAINELKKNTAILFGTDSTVSSDWNCWNQLRLGRKTGLLNDEELFASITTAPAKTRRLNDTGILRESSNADVIIAEKKYDNEMNSFFAVNPESILMIIKNGNIILFDESLLTQFNAQKKDISTFNRISINGRFKYVKGNINHLIKQIKEFSKDISIPVEPA